MNYGSEKYLNMPDRYLKMGFLSPVEYFYINLNIYTKNRSKLPILIILEKFSSKI